MTWSFIFQNWSRTDDLSACNPFFSWLRVIPQLHNKVNLELDLFTTHTYKSFGCVAIRGRGEHTVVWESTDFRISVQYHAEMNHVDASTDDAVTQYLTTA